MTEKLMKNSFTATQLEWPNTMLHAFVDEVIQTRQQIGASASINKLSGWEDPLNDWIKERLGVLTVDLDRLEELSAEGVALSAFSAHVSIGHDLSGNDKNIQQPTAKYIRNGGLRILVKELDRLVVMCSQLDSRWIQAGINAYEHDQAETVLTRCYGICENHGGRANMRPLITGTLPNDLDDGFNFDGRYDVEHVPLDVANMTMAEGLRAQAARVQSGGLTGGSQRTSQTTRMPGTDATSVRVPGSGR